MVLLSAVKSLFESENLFEKGHPVQLLLHIFIQFSQESAVILLQEIETLLPTIPIESRQYIQKAQPKSLTKRNLIQIKILKKF